jgi:hypothetical protein
LRKNGSGNARFFQFFRGFFVRAEIGEIDLPQSFCADGLVLSRPSAALIHRDPVPLPLKGKVASRRNLVAHLLLKLESVGAIINRPAVKSYNNMEPMQKSSYGFSIYSQSPIDNGGK